MNMPRPGPFSLRLELNEGHVYVPSPDWVTHPRGDMKTIGALATTRRLRRLAEAGKELVNLTGCPPSYATVALLTDLRPWDSTTPGRWKWSDFEGDEQLVRFVQQLEAVLGPIPHSVGQGRNAGISKWWQAAMKRWNDQSDGEHRRYRSWLGMKRRYESARRRLDQSGISDREQRRVYP